jgi:hypothetical protein
VAEGIVKIIIADKRNEGFYNKSANPMIRLITHKNIQPKIINCFRLNFFTIKIPQNPQKSRAELNITGVTLAKLDVSSLIICPAYTIIKLTPQNDFRRVK